MRWAGVLVLLGAVVLGHAAVAGEDLVPRKDARGEKVQLPAGVTEETFAPPPVPRFMLEKPVLPLSMDEMIRQTREAEGRATPNLASPKQDVDVTKAGATR
jgi:hypothetical protein